MKYLIYKISGGLYHWLLHLDIAVNLCKETNRILIIDGYRGDKNNEFYIPNFHKFFHIPDFNNFSCNYGNINNNNLINKNQYKPFVNSKVEFVSEEDYRLNGKQVALNYSDIVSSKDDVIICCWFNDYKNYMNVLEQVKVHPQITKTIKKIGVLKNYIGVHYRNTDRKTDINFMCNEILKHKNKFKLLYLSTDDYYAYDEFEKRLKNYFNIIQYTKPIKLKNNINIHDGHNDKDKIIYNTLIDTFYLYKSNIFIPSISSGLSQKVIRIREKNDFFY